MNDATSRDNAREAEVYDVTGYDLSTEEAEQLFADAGVPRSLRTIQRYCKTGYLDAKEYGTANGMMLRINRDSIERRIKEIQQIQSTIDGRDVSRQVTTDVVIDAATTQTNDTIEDRRQTTTHDDTEIRRDMSPQEHQRNDSDDTQRQTTTAATRRDMSSVNEKLVDALVKQLDGKDELIEDLKEGRRNDRKLFTHQFEMMQEQLRRSREQHNALVDYLKANEALPGPTQQIDDGLDDQMPDLEKLPVEPEPVRRPPLGGRSVYGRGNFQSPSAN